MGLNVLGYRSYVLQRYHCACGHRGLSPLSPFLPLRISIAMQIQRSYNLSNGYVLLTRVLTLSSTKVRIQILVFKRIEITTSPRLPH